MKNLLVRVMFAVLLAGPSAFAQPHRASSGRVPPSDREMTFCDELVRSQLVRPDLSGVRGNRATRGTSLLRTRQHFVQEMLKSVENF